MNYFQSNHLKAIVLSSLLNLNQIAFCQVGVSGIALCKWFEGKLINNGAR